MKNTIDIFKKAISYLGMALVVYGVIFFMWIMLMLGCTESHSTGECRDNSLSTFVLYPINLINQ